MRTSTMSRFLAGLLVVLAACSEGGDGGDGSADASSPSPSVDARVVDASDPADARADARIELGTDASSPVGGFAQKCSQTMACPIDAPICVVATPGATEGLCSIVCADDFQVTTDGSGNITMRPDPSTDRACTAAHNGGIGIASCQAFLGNTFQPPVVGQPLPNFEYKIDVACAIRCGLGNTCPSGLRCDTRFQVCAP